MAVLDASITKSNLPAPMEPLDIGATYVFQTREDGKGILQILGTSDEGLKIRYRLIQVRQRGIETEHPARNPVPKTQR